MSDIDPVEFGALKAEVAMLRRETGEMRDDIKALVALANKGKGAYWAGMLLASGLGAGAVTMVKWFLR